MPMRAPTPTRALALAERLPARMCGQAPVYRPALVDGRVSGEMPQSEIAPVSRLEQRRELASAVRPPAAPVVLHGLSAEIRSTSATGPSILPATTAIHRALQTTQESITVIGPETGVETGVGAGVAVGVVDGAADGDTVRTGVTDLEVSGPTVMEDTGVGRSAGDWEPGGWARCSITVVTSVTITRIGVADMEVADMGAITIRNRFPSTMATVTPPQGRRAPARVRPMIC
jgi:hypothetical protein